MNSSFKKLCNTVGVVTAALGVLALGPAACSSDEKVSTGGPAGGTGGGSTGGSSGTAASGGSSGTAATGGTGATDGGATGGTSGTGGSGGVTTAPGCGDRLVGLDAECGGDAVAAEFKTPNMLVVIDKSGSMDDTFGSTTKKWDAMKEALNAVLNASASQIAFGLELYPFPQDPSQPIGLDCGTRCCEHATTNAINVPIESGTTGVPKILSALNATGPGGGTPTAAALQRAYDYFTSGAGAQLQGDRFVLLATDGGPNCNAALNCTPDTCTSVMDGNCPDTLCCAVNDPVAHQQCLDDQEVLKQITALKNAGIPTFVVGIPGTEAYRTYLNQFAVAGGVPNTGGTDSYYNVDTTQGLVDAFTDITRRLVTSCEIQLTQNPPDKLKVNVAVNCEVVAQTSPDGSGWTLNETTQPNTIVLSGPLCEWIQTNGAERIDVLMGCPTVLDPR
jgi:hypothetical protein